MRVLVTGSSGTLGAALVARLRAEDCPVVGLDPLPSETTDVVGSVVDEALLRDALRIANITAIIHAGGLHKPQVATHAKSAFVDANVHGTLALLEAATAPGSLVDRFVFTSTTSLMIDRDIRAGKERGATSAFWLTETHGPLRPRNIYGVTKLAAEQLCRLHHELTGLPIVILRVARFFPEADDQAHRIKQSAPNTKANELLFRRLVVDDVVRSHLLALEAAPSLGHDLFLITADTPFTPGDCDELLKNAPAVVARYFPQMASLYAAKGWSMFDSIGRVYDPTAAKVRLGFRAERNFTELLSALAEGVDVAPWVGE